MDTKREEGGKSSLSFAVLAGLSVSVLCSGCAENRPLTLKNAERRIIELPEVRAFDARVQNLSHGEVREVVFLDGDGPDSWDFYVGEDHGDQSVRWHTFQVNKASGSISVDLPDGDYISLEQWRRLGAK